jgi:hypothetical protein
MPSRELHGNKWEEDLEIAVSGRSPNGMWILSSHFFTSKMDNLDSCPGGQV